MMHQADDSFTVPHGTSAVVSKPANTKTPGGEAGEAAHPARILAWTILWLTIPGFLTLPVLIFH